MSGQPPLHVVVVGAGAVGLLYGGWLLAGAGEVSFLARRSTLERLRARGLELRGDRGGFRREAVRVAERVEDLPPADVLLYTVKLYDLASAAAATRHGLRPGGLAVGLQNGVSAQGVLADAFPAGQVLVGPTYSAARLAADGAVEYSGRRHRVVLGGPAAAAPAAHALVEAWRRAGVEAELTGDIATVLWTKFLGFATNAALTCLSRQAAGVCYGDPDLLDLARRSIREVMAVAAAEGVTLSAAAEDDTVALLQSFPPDMVASMRQDLDAGRRLELDGVCGTLRDLGRRRGVPTPVHDVAYACLKPYREGAAAAAPLREVA